MKIEPNFEISENGRVICREHTNYLHFIEPNKDYFENLYLDLEITCKKCTHYKNNDCYFSKSKIDEVDYDRINKKIYKCKFCSGKIHRMQTIIYKLYNEEAYSIDIPITCCNCYDNIFDGEFKRESKKRISVDIFALSLLVFTFFIFLYLMSSLDFISSYLILFVIPWTIFIIIDLKRLKNNILGIKYYKKYFPKFEEISEIIT